MPKKKEDEAAPATGAIVTPAPAGEATPAKVKKVRLNIAEQNFVVFAGGRAPKAFVADEAAVKAFIAGTDTKKQSKICVFKRIPLKIQVSVEI